MKFFLGGNHSLRLSCTARPHDPHRASTILPSFCALRTPPTTLYLSVNMLEGGDHAARWIHFKPCLS